MPQAFAPAHGRGGMMGGPSGLMLGGGGFAGGGGSSSGMMAMSGGMLAGPPDLMMEVPETPPNGCSMDAIKLFIGNIPKSCTEEQLQPFFETIGKVGEEHEFSSSCIQLQV